MIIGLKNTREFILENKILFSLVISILVLGSVFYHFVEGLSVVDAVYFSVITLTTVGYGDISPQTQVGKVFTIFYIFFSLGVIFAFIDSIANHRIKSSKQRVRKKKEK